MTFDWNLDHQTGQPELGIVLEYSAALDTGQGTIVPAKALIHAFSHVRQARPVRVAHVTVFLAADRARITDGFFHWLHDDIADLIKNEEHAIFSNDSEPLDCFQTQVILCRELPHLEIMTAGSYAIIS